MINTRVMSDKEKDEYAEFTTNVIEMLLKYADKKRYDRDEFLDDFFLRVYPIIVAGSFINYVAKKDKKNEDPWNPADEPPDDDRPILVSFENTGMPAIAYYRRDDDGGGAYYIDECYMQAIIPRKSLQSFGLFVNGWMNLPKCKREE
jgi:hypothetical protein